MMTNIPIRLFIVFYRTYRLVFMIFLCALLVSPVPLAAATDAIACAPRDTNQACQNFYISNNLPYYDPEDIDRTTCGTATTGSSSGSIPSSASQDKNAEEILKFFTGKGLTLAQAAGFVGNMMQESSLNPAIIEGGAIAPANYQPVNGKGFGLVQWTFTSRQQPLVNLANSTNRSVTDMGLQLDYIWQELNGPYKATLQALAARPAATPTEAAMIIHGNTFGSDSRYTSIGAPTLGYEASADSADGVINKRGGTAESFYNKFKGSIQDGAGIQGPTGTSTPASDSTPSCDSGVVASTTCSASGPVYGAGGNGHQLTTAELTKQYGAPNTPSNMVAATFLGFNIAAGNGIHKSIAGCLQAVSDELKAKGVTYKIDQMACYRPEGADMKYHAFGAACDINPDANPCIQCGYNPKGLPAGAYDIPQVVIDAFAHHGWSWGGSWGSPKDYMHFEYNGTSL